LRDISNLRFRSVRPTKPRYGVLQNEFVSDSLREYLEPAKEGCRALAALAYPTK